MQRLPVPLARLVVFATISTIAISAPVHAQVVGTFNGVGSGTLGGSPSNVLATFTGGVFAIQPLTGIFAAIPPLTPGTAQSITVGVGPASIANFLNLGGYSFSLTSIVPGAFGSAQCFVAPAAGQTCSVAGSGFNYSNQSNGGGGVSALAGFGFSGIVTAPSSQQYDYTGTFSSQFTGLSYQQLLASFNAGTPVASSYSLNIIATARPTTVPEPASVLLLGTGLMALALVARRSRRRMS